MIEVFKTNVRSKDDASQLIDRIHKTFTDYRANFDLEDCDKILRVKSAEVQIQSSLLIKLLSQSGFFAEVLPDDEFFI
ncbi:hypothetical protein [Dyadobacter sp. NIV53]|uniref:hypothetical protein n=1 Tax=Dyadobacter sp. NIV53 TaxID=2861765 RepID=UPI001C87DEE1|nr:hypothetical protein [Dyadobacter sp. NIV53]